MPLSSTRRSMRTCVRWATCAARWAPAELPDSVTDDGDSSATTTSTARRHCSTISPMVAAGASVYSTAAYDLPAASSSAAGKSESPAPSACQYPPCTNTCSGAPGADSITSSRSSGAPP